MNKKVYQQLKKIITYIKELELITKGRNDKYFYDGFELPILCDLVDKIDRNINIISPKIKRKYSNVNWNIIDSRKEIDNGIKILKLVKIWELSNGLLNKELYNNLNHILEIELPVYYTNYCNKQHNIFLKKTKENK